MGTFGPRVRSQLSCFYLSEVQVPKLSLRGLDCLMPSTTTDTKMRGGETAPRAAGDPDGFAQSASWSLAPALPWPSKVTKLRWIVGMCGTVGTE